MPVPDSAPWSRRAELAATAAFWGGLTVLLLVRRAAGPLGLTPGVAVATVAEYAPWVVLTPLVFALARRVPLDARLARRVALLVAVGLGLAIAVEVGRRLLFWGLLDVPRRGPRRPGLRLFGRPQFLDEFVIYAGVLAAGYARTYALRAARRETEAARLAEQLGEARLDALRMQLNPHFLFNALNAVSAYVERDPERAQTMIAQLGGLLRRVLDGDARTQVPLSDEAAFLGDYLAIQQARFGDGLAVDVRLGADLLGALVPPLVLQPLAENAVEHGVSRLAGETGRITVAARRDAGRLVLSVADNGPGRRGPDGRGVGLANTRARLAALYGDAARLDLADAPGGGTVATVTIPYQTDA